MTISETIAALEAAKEKYGDIKVYVRDGVGDFDDLTEVEPEESNDGVWEILLY
jgi:hypothetical protein